MTLAELERALDSKRRKFKTEAKQKASFDYILADLIGKSIGRIYSSTTKIPEIHEVYPTLFDAEEIREEKRAKQDELSALRFRQFAQSYNKKFREEGAKQDE